MKKIVFGAVIVLLMVGSYTDFNHVAEPKSNVTTINAESLPAEVAGINSIQNQQINTSVLPEGNTNEVNINENPQDLFEIPLDKNGNRPTIIASYGDGSASLAEVNQRATAVVLGKATSKAEKSALGVVVNFSVTETIKGEKIDEARIYQLNNPSELLEIGKEYVLFLNYQLTEATNDFYIVGANQGKFLYEKGKLTGLDAAIDTSFQIQISKQKAQSKRMRNSSEPKDLDVMIDFVTN